MPGRSIPPFFFYSQMHIQSIDNAMILCYNSIERRGKEMTQGNLNIRMDNDLKQNFDSVCNDLGMSMSTAVTLLAKKMTREKRLPFEVSMDPFYSASNQAALNASIAQMQSGKTVTKSMEELERMADE
nr:MAG TPA: RelB antitoxin [Caudoviricetes sp.]